MLSRLPLRLLALVLGLPACTALLLGFLDPLRCEIHSRLLGYSLARGDRSGAEKEARLLLTLPERELRRFVRSTARWRIEDRQWLAEILLPRDDDALPPQLRAALSLPPRSDERTDLVLRLILEIDPKNREALLGLASRESDAGNAASVIELMQRTLAIAEETDSDGTYQEIMLLADALREMDRNAEAVPWLEKAALMMRGVPDPLLLLVEAHERTSNHLEAVRAATRMLRLERAQDLSLRAEILARRAVSLGLWGRGDLALLDLDAALGLHRLAGLEPGGKQPYEIARANALSRMGDSERGIAALTEILRREPSNPIALVTRAGAYQDAGRSREAVADYREAILCGANAPVVFNNLAWVLLTAERPEDRDPGDALRLARKAAAIAGANQPFLLDTLAEACYQNRLFDEAVRWETAALERGGETYRVSLDRFRAAADAARQGRNPDLSISPLKEHHKPPRGDGGQAFRPENEDAPPRLPAAALRLFAFQRIRDNKTQDFDLYGATLARLWKEQPPSAIDDPRADLRALLLALASAPASPILRSRSPTLFLQGLRQGLGVRELAAAQSFQTEEEAFGKTTPPADPEARLGFETAWLPELPRKEAAAILDRMAAGLFLPCELFAPACHKRENEERNPAGEELIRRVRARIREVASGASIRPPTGRWRPSLPPIAPPEAPEPPPPRLRPHGPVAPPPEG